MTSLTLSEMVLRLLAAFVAGFAVGWERESHGRPAGLRTTILACVASALAMILSEVLFVQSAAATQGGSWRPDPARLGAAVLTGIGFLGGGTILRHDNAIRGVTTAATLWCVTVLGLAFGSGQFLLGLLGTALALPTLFLLPRFEKHVHSDWYSTLVVTTTIEGLTEDELRARIEALGPVVKTMKLDYDLAERRKKATFELRVNKDEVFALSTKVVRDLVDCPGVLEVNWT